jgi:hypothetical protein
VDVLLRRARWNVKAAIVIRSRSDLPQALVPAPLPISCGRPSEDAEGRLKDLLKMDEALLKWGPRPSAGVVERAIADESFPRREVGSATGLWRDALGTLTFDAAPPTAFDTPFDLAS